MSDNKKRILVCDDSYHDVGRLADWLRYNYVPIMATTLERGQYQIPRQKFDLIVADLTDSGADAWLSELEKTGQRVLHLGRYKRRGRLHLFKPQRKDFETFQVPFLLIVRLLLDQPAE